MHDIMEKDRSSVPVLGESLRYGKRERTKASNREAILSAASEVFGEIGYGAATVRDIIRRTNLASGTFYNYYKNKEEIFEALMDDGALRIRPVIRAERLRSHSFEEFVRNAYRAYFHYLLNDKKQFRLLRRNTGALRVRMDTPEVLAGFDEIRSYIDEDIASGKVPPVDSELLTAAAIGIVQEMGDRMLMRDNPDPGKIATFAANLLLAGMPGIIDDRGE